MSQAEELRKLMAKMENPTITSDGSILKEAATASNKRRLMENSSMKANAIKVAGELRKMAKGFELDGSQDHGEFARQAHQSLTDLYQMMPHLDMSSEQGVLKDLLRKANLAVKGEYTGNLPNEVVNALYPIMQKLQSNESTLSGSVSLAEDSSYDKSEALDDLMELKNQMDQLVSQIEDTLRSTFPEQYESARVYWLAHIKSALGEHGYSTTSPTFTSTLEEIEGTTYDDGDEEEYTPGAYR